ncbi:AAA family ATPase [Enterobacteriaceae bacterium Kacie_13]|nr:AAA family ATPase [Enterobacteriaceae bacterium Kacie_13]
MELLYFYIQKVRGETYDLSFDFNGSFVVEHDKQLKSLKFTARPQRLPDNFFGTYITNVNAVIGRNGSGKSTMLSLLGLKKVDRRFELQSAKWFAVYYVADNTFVVEGQDSSLLEESPYYTDKDYFFQTDINALKYSTVLSDSGYIDQEIRRTVVLHFPEMKLRRPDSQEDMVQSFKREYLYQGKAWVYKYLIRKYKDLDEKISDQSLVFRISNSFTNNNYNDNKLIEIYNDLDGFYTANINTDMPYPKRPILITGYKNLFIIHLLEMLINEYALEAVSVTMPDSIDKMIDSKNAAKFTRHNKKISSQGGYDALKARLLKKLKKVISITSEIYGTSIHINWDKIVKYLESLDDKDFSTNGYEFTLVSQLSKIDPNIYSILLELENEAIRNVVDVRFPYKSDGESAIINKLSAICCAVEKNIKLGFDKFILLLDEIDLHLHPEWSRKFLCILLEILEELSNDSEFEPAESFQVIMTTHAPYIISDLPKEKIIKIVRDEQEFLHTVPSSFGFASNIHDIINDSFFLSTTIGEFASKKLEPVIKFLNNPQHIKPEDLKNIYRTINLVDDRFVKNKLLQMFASRPESKSDKQKELLILEAKVMQLKQELENDKD